MKKDFKTIVRKSFITGFLFCSLLFTNGGKLLAQCSELYNIQVNGCSVTFNLVGGPTTGWTYQWTVQHLPSGPTFTSTSPNPTFNLPAVAPPTWKVTFTAYDAGKNIIFLCDTEFAAPNCEQPCLTASPRVSCSQLIVDFQTVGPANAQHCWDFGDGNGFCVDANFAAHCYVNINTVVTPQVTVTVAIAGVGTCSTVVDFTNPNPNTTGEPPIEGIFIGKICENRNLSEYVNMPLPLPNTNPANLTLPPPPSTVPTAPMSIWRATCRWT